MISGKIVDLTHWITSSFSTPSYLRIMNTDWSQQVEPYEVASKAVDPGAVTHRTPVRT